ncbi:MAG: hypothetical protein HOP19_13365, partial [Acidobacteria bacterium]|nr:hypothetical protein [Acidobacteriota bacterium]
LYVGGVFSEAYGLAGNTVSVPGLARWANNTWTTVGTSAIKAMSITSAASFVAGETSTEAIMTAFGTGLASGTDFGKTVPLPTNLLNSRVDVLDSLGTTRAAQLFFVSPGQVNFLIPAGTAPGTATITLTAGDGSVSQGTVNVVSYSPGLFTYNANGQGVAAAVIARYKVGSTTPLYESLARYDTATSRWVTTPINLGPVGERVFLVAYGTAFRGRASVIPVTVTMGGTVLPNVLAGASPGFVGLDQLNAEIPRSLIGRNSELDVVLTVGTKTANTVKIFVQ